MAGGDAERAAADGHAGAAQKQRRRRVRGGEGGGYGAPEATDGSAELWEVWRWPGATRWGRLFMGIN